MYDVGKCCFTCTNHGKCHFTERYDVVVVGGDVISQNDMTLGEGETHLTERYDMGGKCHLSYCMM